MKRATKVRRNAAALPWLRALAFAALAFAAVSMTGFYPVAFAPLVALVVGALGVFAPGVGILLFIVVTGVPVLAGDIVFGAAYLVIGMSALQYLSDDDGRAFLVVAAGFASTFLHAEWAVAALAGYVMGASDGAIAAFVACLAIQAAGFLLGADHVGILATGGTKAAVDLTAIRALGDTSNVFAFGWLAPAIARIDIAGDLKTLAGIRDVVVFALQPFIWAGGASLAGTLRRPIGDPRRAPFGLLAVWAGVAAIAAASTALVIALGARVPFPDLGLATVVSLVVGGVGVVIAEYIFPLQKIAVPAVAPTDPDEADVDELLRTISSAEEELASKHTVSRTVLITDMKSFSRLTQELGSTETAKLVQRHRDLCLPIVTRHGGHGKSTGGDGLLAAFESPADALAAASEMQLALAEYNAKRQGEEAVLIRAGAAIGELVLDKGGKPFLGDALNLAARIMSLADGGQVFTSRTVLERAGDPSFRAVSHGTFRLKNIADAIEVVEILWSADQQARPPRPESDD